MPTCSFSGEKIEPGTGTMYIKKDGKVLWFKNSKARKNYIDLGRKPLKTRWTMAYRQEHKKGQSPLNSPAESKKGAVADKKVVDSKMEKDSKMSEKSSEQKDVPMETAETKKAVKEVKETKGDSQ